MVEMARKEVEGRAEERAARTAGRIARTAVLNMGVQLVWNISCGGKRRSVTRHGRGRVTYIARFRRVPNAA